MEKMAWKMKGAQNIKMYIEEEQIKKEIFLFLWKQISDGKDGMKSEDAPNIEEEQRKIKEEKSMQNIYGSR